MENIDVNAFKEFCSNFMLLASKNHKAIVNTLSNVFTMRIIGNKTHGDLAEIAISEFINQFMYNYKSEHVGKDLFRAKAHEEDILVTHELSLRKIPISLKAYGDGPLQLSTDKDGELFPLLLNTGKRIVRARQLSSIFSSKPFQKLSHLNILPLIYREVQKQCNIVLFDYQRVVRETAKILFVDAGQRFDYEKGLVVVGKGRSHPVFIFLTRDNRYLCEVRYGGKSANALQRGFWTHTDNAKDCFVSLTNGWIDYSHNLVLVKLFSLALNSTVKAHQQSCDILQDGIDSLKVM
jgi:hypothetical protein